MKTDMNLRFYFLLYIYIYIYIYCNQFGLGHWADLFIIFFFHQFGVFELHLKA